MKYPSFYQEKKLWKKGYKRVACLDESGRGPLAGPVVAATTVMVKNPKSQIRLIAKQLQGAKRLVRISKQIPNSKIQITKIKDSKKLTPKQREEFYKLIIRNQNIEWGIGRVSEKVIDKINILEATKLAMVRAIKKLKQRPDFLLIDGNFNLPAKALAKAGINSKVPQKSIIKADEKVFSCCLASIIAKVYRDRIMKKLHKKYPKYGLDRHKGYPTKYHLKMLKKYGPCKIHRKTFGPVLKILKIKD